MQQTVLGSFRLLRALGQGSFATAYLAEQAGTDRKAVVKIAHAHLVHSNQGQMVRERFASEVRAATRVTHPNLATIYTAGETDDGLPALAMEYLDGETLGQRLQRGDRFTGDELIRVFGQLASALDRVHAHRIIHRDVSPENVFLVQTPEGLAVKLLDFGIARLQDLATTAKTTVGTPLYMAIEQMQGQAIPASDVYSVGALLWWCLTGRELHREISGLVQLMYHLAMQREPPDALAHCPAMPAKTARLLSSMLHPRAPERPTMAGFLAEWSAQAPELRRWWSSLARCRVALLTSQQTLSEEVSAALRADGHAVLRLEARVSALLSHAPLDAVVIDAEITEPNPVSLARHLEQVLPGVRVFAVSMRPFASAWLSAPARLLALVPEQLPQLCHALVEGCAGEAQATLASPFAQQALGEIPELLAGLEEAQAHGDRAGSILQCRRLERVAHLASLAEIGSLARTLRVLQEQDAVEDAAGFVEQLQRSFLDCFPALLAAQKRGETP